MFFGAQTGAARGAARMGAGALKARLQPQGAACLDGLRSRRERKCPPSVRCSATICRIASGRVGLGAGCFAIQRSRASSSVGGKRTLIGVALTRGRPGEDFLVPAVMADFPALTIAGRSGACNALDGPRSHGCRASRVLLGVLGPLAPGAKPVALALLLRLAVFAHPLLAELPPLTRGFSLLSITLVRPALEDLVVQA